MLVDWMPVREVSPGRWLIRWADGTEEERDVAISVEYTNERTGDVTVAKNVRITPCE